jgi:nitric oxide reductase NorE protein
MSILLFFSIRMKNNNADVLNIRTLETGATYWHMVDLLWIVLFPLLYLLR